MIGFGGLSHLGIISSVATAAKGYEVIAYDPNEALCEQLCRGQAPIYEPGLDELLASVRSRIHFVADPARLQKCEVIFCAADVPTDGEDCGDVAALRKLIDQLVAYAAPGVVLVVQSQVPPGFTRRLDGGLANTHTDRGIQVFYQAETLVFGQALGRALHPERYIVGCRDPEQALPQPYAAWLNAWSCPNLPMGYESAELAKIAINAYLTSSICVTNTLAELCEALGADWREIAPALKLDKRIGPHAYLSPGLGLAGGNLERDLTTLQLLAEEFGTDAGVVEAWRSNSHHRRDWVLQLICREVVPRCQRPVIAIWGLAYKPNTVSTKNAPALDLIAALREFPVQAYDPRVVLSPHGLSNLALAPLALDACREADVLVVMTPWPEFSSLNLARARELMRGRVIIDPFGALDQRRCVELGFAYFRLGAPPQPPAGRV